MNYFCECEDCGATAWIKGNYDFDDGSTNLKDDDKVEWELAGSADNHVVAMCDHQHIKILEQEHDYHPDDVF